MNAVDIQSVNKKNGVSGGVKMNKTGCSTVGDR